MVNSAISNDTSYGPSSLIYLIVGIVPKYIRVNATLFGIIFANNGVNVAHIAIAPKNTKYTVNNPLSTSLGKYLNKRNIPNNTQEPTKGNFCASAFVIVSVSPF